MLIGYARVSTSEQNIDLQLDALQAAGCKKIFQDIGISGSTSSRPGLDAALDHARDGDELVVWRLDRVGRSTKNVLGLVDDLSSREVGFRSLTEDISTSGPTGKLLLTLIAALAEMERAVLVERTHAGLAAARARGRVGGRKRSLSPKQDRAIRTIYDARQTPIAEIAAAFKVSQPTVWRSLSRTRPEIEALA
ncbi:recombinase family protein [Pseudolysinimonas yzui]|uniref:Resolvase n=1 Tax=Pseudolysinimonas yzui TaxID=2708254 RepID=A0A8J3M5N5_9MICO|nr:recombinase family protein [Pseudolysinimonas yzui]GHF22515.1 resolvase [Pseudolysinimonas yzui]